MPGGKGLASCFQCPAQVSLDICQIFLKPTDPAHHSGSAGIVLAFQTVLSDFAVQDISDNPGIVVLVRDHTVRKFHMKLPAMAAVQPTDQVVFLSAACQPMDTPASVTIPQLLPAVRTYSEV